MKPRIRVLCVDDHRIVRDGLALIIGEQPDLEIVGQVASAGEAEEFFRRLQPDVTLMDLRLRGSSGVDAIRAIRQQAPDARVIVLTMYEGDEDIYRALDAGAVTYLLKDTLAEELVRTIRKVHAGERPLSAEVQERLAARAAGPTLTRREVKVMELLAQGMRNKEIAAMLAISEATIQVHVKNVFAKLQVHDRTAAVHVALRRGIIHLA